MSALLLAGRVVSGAAIVAGSAVGTLILLIEHDTRRMNRQRATR